MSIDRRIRSKVHYHDADKTIYEFPISALKFWERMEQIQSFRFEEQIFNRIEFSFRIANVSGVSHSLKIRHRKSSQFSRSRWDSCEPMYIELNPLILVFYQAFESLNLCSSREFSNFARKWFDDSPICRSYPEKNHIVHQRMKNHQWKYG